MRIRIRASCALAALWAACLAMPAAALTVTPEECAEGADFIRNAALSRDNGLRAELFLQRMEDDFVAIRGVPVALRWFARDEDDEGLLRTAAIGVFVDPRTAHEHHREFLATCRATVAAATPGRIGPSADASPGPR